MKTRLLTFNLFFDPVAMTMRMRAIGQLIERYRPAVIGFQEVTQESLSLLKKQLWASYYDCSVDIAPPFSSTYFVAMFTALPIRQLETFPFPNTHMGRELVMMTVEIMQDSSKSKQTLVVGTSHLESLPQNASTRISQLKQSFQMLQERANEDDACVGAVLMGDMNLIRSDMKLLDDQNGATACDFQVEKAKSGRSKCRHCHQSIGKDSIRIGKRGRDKLPTGKTVELMQWYHKECVMESSAVATEKEKAFLRASSPLLGGKTNENDENEQENDENTLKSIDLATMGLPEGWSDLWLTIEGHTEDNGCTFDGKKNAMVTQSSFQSRLDRMYFYAKPRNKRHTYLEAMELIGTEPIYDKIWPSDHFGLLGTFGFNQNDTKPNQDDGSKDHPIAIH